MATPTRFATAGVAPYAVFKGGLGVLTRYMAKEFGERRIRANAVSSGATCTELGGGLNDESEALLVGQKEPRYGIVHRLWATVKRRDQSRLAALEIARPARR